MVRVHSIIGNRTTMSGWTDEYGLINEQSHEFTDRANKGIREKEAI